MAWKQSSASRRQFVAVAEVIAQVHHTAEVALILAATEPTEARRILRIGARYALKNTKAVRS